MPDDKKPEAKKEEVKKEAKKEDPKKEEVKKEELKKEEPKKETPKEGGKEAAEKDADKKDEAKKEEAKKEDPKKEELKKETADAKKLFDGPLPNKPGEPDFQLQIEPKTKIVFKSDRMLEETQGVEMKITNSTAKRHAYKIKCTSNDIFRVRPPFGFVNANSSTTLRIAFHSKELRDPDRHFIAAYHVVVTDEKMTQSKLAWTANTKCDGVIRLPVRFEKADGSPWTTDK